MSFVDAVKALPRNLSITTSLLSPIEAGYFHRLKQMGCRRVIAESRVAANLPAWAMQLDEWSEVEEALMFSMGDYVVSRLPAHIVRSYLPFSAFTILPAYRDPRVSS